MSDYRDHLRALADALPPEAIVPVPVAWLRELLPPRSGTPPDAERTLPIAKEPAPEDRLLAVAEAALRLGVTPAWLYRHARDLPFAVKLGRRTLRFSSAKLERYIARRSAAWEAPQ